MFTTLTNARYPMDNLITEDYLNMLVGLSDKDFRAECEHVSEMIFRKSCDTRACNHYKQCFKLIAQASTIRLHNCGIRLTPLIVSA